MPSVRFIQNGDTKKNIFSLKPVFFGTVVMFIVSTILIFATAAIFLYSGLSQNLIPLISKVILYVTVLTGGIMSGIKSKFNGWMYGAISGILFSVLLILISTLLGIRTNFDIFSVASVVICAFLSAIGGVFGINIKPKAKRSSKSKY